MIGAAQSSANFQCLIQTVSRSLIQTQVLVVFCKLKSETLKQGKAIFVIEADGRFVTS